MNINESLKEFCERREYPIYAVVDVGHTNDRFQYRLIPWKCEAKFYEAFDIFELGWHERPIDGNKSIFFDSTRYIDNMFELIEQELNKNTKLLNEYRLFKKFKKLNLTGGKNARSK
jgi:hypothetical protein